MKVCPVCCSEIHDYALKCPKCLAFIKPRINEGQFWGTCLMIGGILTGAASYLWFLSRISNSENVILFMYAGIIMAYLGFLIYAFGTFRTWFTMKGADELSSEQLEPGQKRCFFCGEIIDVRAVKCRYCLSFQRQEKGKILATFMVVSGIMILTTAYILFLAQNLQSELYMQVGLAVILVGVVMFLYMMIRNRYSSR
jgi:hypothetical protein